LSYGLSVETKAADGLFVENVKYTSSYTRLNQPSYLIVWGFEVGQIQNSILSRG